MIQPEKRWREYTEQKRVQKTRILRKEAKYPKVITKNKTITDEWYPDNNDQAATLKLQLHKGVFACLLSSAVPAVSDRIKDVIVFFSVLDIASLHSWITEPFPGEDFWPSIAFEMWVSKVDKRVVPNSLVPQSSLAVEGLPSDAKLCH